MGVRHRKGRAFIGACFLQCLSLLRVNVSWVLDEICRLLHVLLRWFKSVWCGVLPRLRTAGKELTWYNLYDCLLYS